MSQMEDDVRKYFVEKTFRKSIIWKTDKEIVV
jgi:hypothetical protein